MPPPGPAGQLRDAQLSSWVTPTAGRYADAVCRAGGGPRPKDPNTPCPECCSEGEWTQEGAEWSWAPNDAWHGSTLNEFSAACWRAHPL